MSTTRSVWAAPEYVEYERKLLIKGILKGLDRDILRLACGSSKVLWVRTFVHLLKHSYPKSKNSANDAMNKRRLKFEKEITAMSENGEAGS